MHNETKIHSEILGKKPLRSLLKGFETLEELSDTIGRFPTGKLEHNAQLYEIVEAAARYTSESLSYLKVIVSPFRSSHHQDSLADFSDFKVLETIQMPIDY
ncbi:hypothetical protein MMC17_006582 [Xylographa soralifera]|nr:hypothetical protein [Xylographa soralifera]